MQKTTVLAKLRLIVRFTPDGLTWVRRSLPNTSLTEGDATDFLLEFAHRWEKRFLDTSQRHIQEYFRNARVPEDVLPVVEHAERYRGSLIVDAAIVMFTSIGTAYTILKGISELPAIADGLTKLKDRILSEVRPMITSSVRDTVWDVEPNFVKNLPPRREPPPANPLDTDLTIDARPVTSLTPAKLKAHRLHLACAISRETFTLENLGEEPLRDLRLGLFSSPTARNQWSYADAYMTTVPMLSGGQTLAKPVSDFKHRNGQSLDPPDTPLFVDCWVQDNYGIYLFNFFLEEE